MVKRTLTQLLIVTLLAGVWALPETGLAQDASSCVQNEQGDGCLPVAPESERIDLAEPSFSDPTLITNPLFPISELTQVIQLGVDAGESLRVEATLLPETKTIDWNGQPVETLVSQYVAYLDGRIVEVANDFYAQADDGAVWYFGEDVFNYEDGVVANTDGTWLAGKDGPPGMIMPTDPQVGDVYRPENIPGFVFEEVTVKATDQTVDGPQGPVKGAIVIQELLMDGTLEEKSFAPGYGEFSAKTDTEDITVALGVPFDAQPGAAPAALETMSTGAADIFEAAPTENWNAITATVATMTTAWETYRAGDMPPVLSTQMSDALAALTEAADAQDPGDTRQAAVDLGRASLDLQLQHRSLTEVDLARLELWTQQLLVDLDANDRSAASGDVATLESVWARVAHTVDQPMVEQSDTELAGLRTAVDSGDLSAATDTATRLRVLLNGGADGASAFSAQPAAMAEDGRDENEPPVAPGRLDDGEELLPQAEITLEQAVSASQGAASGPVGEVDLEDYRGRLVFNVDVGTEDVKVDATTGEVLGTESDD